MLSIVLYGVAILCLLYALFLSDPEIGSPFFIIWYVFAACLLACGYCTSHQLWDTIPPTVPDSLKAYLGRIVRNLSLNRLRWKKEQKRDCDANVLLSEISDCIQAKDDVEHTIDQKLLSELIAKWLSGEKEVNRQIFVRRYWYGSTYRELEQHYGLSEKKLMDRLYHMRGRLREYLEKEGISV